MIHIMHAGKMDEDESKVARNILERFYAVRLTKYIAKMARDLRSKKYPKEMPTRLVTKQMRKVFCLKRNFVSRPRQEL